MFKFAIEFDDKKFLETLKNVGSEETYSRLASSVAAEIETSVKDNTPVKTGNLRRSFFHSPSLGTQTLERRVTSKAPYAVYVEEGTRAHIIRPKNAKALAWEAVGQKSFMFATETIRTTSKMFKGKKLAKPKTEFIVFAKSVNHPGTKAVRMLENTLITLKPWIEEQMTNTINNLWGK